LKKSSTSPGCILRCGNTRYFPMAADTREKSFQSMMSHGCAGRTSNMYCEVQSRLDSQATMNRFFRDALKRPMSEYHEPIENQSIQCPYNPPNLIWTAYPQKFPPKADAPLAQTTHQFPPEADGPLAQTNHQCSNHLAFSRLFGYYWRVKPRGTPTSA
jgi:hypothetical protein